MTNIQILTKKNGTINRYYKLVKNPNGRLTQKIIQKQKIIGEKNREKNINSYLRMGIAKNTIINEWKKQDKLQLEQYMKWCYDWINKPKKWDMVKIIETKKTIVDERKKWQIMGINQNEYNLLHNSAKQKNLEIRKGIFGKREIYEEGEELEELLTNCL